MDNHIQSISSLLVMDGGIIVMFDLNSIILGKKEFVNSKIRICVGCGSTTVFQNQQSIMCKDCGNVGYFSN